MISHCSAKDIHLGARSEQNGTAKIVLIKRIFQVRKTVEKLSCTLVVPDVNDFVSVADARIFHILLNCVLDGL